MGGKVFLVGAGPGDPGLLTLKGRRCLEQADVVIYDRLANPRLLDFARPDAELIYAGKAPDEHTVAQEEICRMMIEKARDGHTICRLKGGDPFIFGRGGEEALALAEARVRFEIVPGVTSAYAAPAYAGIPLTFRGKASSVTFITGHEDPSKADGGVNWDLLADRADTLVFLMGMKRLPIIVDRLLAAGRAPDTPVAIVRWGTTARQEVLRGGLSDIVRKVSAAGFKPPAVIVVGEVAALADELDWSGERPLSGTRILVTRAKEQASELTAKLEELGAEVFECPVIRTAPPDDWAPLDEAIGRLGGYGWAVFTSANGVRFLFERLADLGKDARALGGVKLGAIGPATARELEARGVKADLVPKEFHGEAVAAALHEALGDVAGVRILVPQAVVARDVLPVELGRLGAEVDVVPAYQTVPDESKAAEAKALLSSGGIDVVTFTSGSTARNLMAILGDDALELLGRVKIACIGPITTGAAEKLGLRVAATAAEYTVPGLVEAILTLV